MTFLKFWTCFVLPTKKTFYSWAGGLANVTFLKFLDMFYTSYQENILFPEIFWSQLNVSGKKDRNLHMCVQSAYTEAALHIQWGFRKLIGTLYRGCFIYTCTYFGLFPTGKGGHSCTTIQRGLCTYWVGFNRGHCRAPRGFTWELCYGVSWSL